MSNSVMQNPRLVELLVQRAVDENGCRLAQRAAAKEMAASNPPLLDAKGRAVPPDVRSMVNQMKQNRP